MSERKHKEEILFDALNKQRMEASDEAREKSLRAFQEGLKDASPQNIKRKRQNIKKQLIGLSSTIVAIGIVIVLALSAGIFDDRHMGDMNTQENEIIEDQENVHAVFEGQTKKNSDSDIVEQIWERHPFNYDESAGFKSMGVFNDSLMIYLPMDWTKDEIEGENTYSIRLSGTEGEQMNLLLFQEDNQEIFDAQLQEIIADFSKAERISIPSIPIEKFADRIKSNQEIYFRYDNVFPFEMENAEITTFIDETNDKLKEVYVSELFGYPMIFTSELSLDDVESWNLPIHFFAGMHINEAFVVRDSEGELHPEFNRPIEKTVLLPIGATFTPDKVEMELHEIEELHVTGYLPKNTEIQRIEHEHFIEWRFTEPDISKNSFYSIGKLNNDFSLENGKEIMFEAFDIDPAYSPPVEGDNPHHYSYDTANADETSIGFGGYFELFEANGEWYYKHKHADWQEYNGGFLISRLNYFINSLEWQ